MAPDDRERAIKPLVKRRTAYVSVHGDDGEREKEREREREEEGGYR